MKALFATAAVGLSLMGALGPVSAQPYGGRDYGYGDRDYRSRDRDDGYRDRGRGYGGRESAFDEREYLRCNPDVRRAVERGQMESALAHYQTFGRRERRRLSC